VHLFGVDAPCIVLVRDLRLVLTVVAVEITERAVTLLDDFDSEGSIVCDAPAEFVPIVDIELSTDASRNVRLISRYLALGINALATHVQEEETEPYKILV
jgi:hypothetical protein